MDELTKYIEIAFKFTNKEYPELKNTTEEEMLHFAIRHSALHFAKTAGRIATLSEDADHGGLIDMADLKKNTAKALINALRLAALINLNEAEMVNIIKEIIEPSNNELND